MTFFRMLARCAGGGPEGPEFERMEAPLTFRDGPAAPKAYGGLKSLAVRRGGDLVITVFNRHGAWSDEIEIDFSRVEPAWRWAVVHETSARRRDEVTAASAIPGNRRLRLRLPPRSLIQVLIGPLDPDAIESVRLVECAYTPGTLASLGSWQTTRLRAIARLREGGEVDVNNHHVVWRSDAPWLVRVGQGGLVQRLRRSERPVRVEARSPDGRIFAAAEVAPA